MESHAYNNSENCTWTCTITMLSACHSVKLNVWQNTPTFLQGAMKLGDGPNEPLRTHLRHEHRGQACTTPCWTPNPSSDTVHPLRHADKAQCTLLDAYLLPKSHKSNSNHNKTFIKFKTNIFESQNRIQIKYFYSLNHSNNILKMLITNQRYEINESQRKEEKYIEIVLVRRRVAS